MPKAFACFALVLLLAATACLNGLDASERNLTDLPPLTVTGAPIENGLSTNRLLPATSTAVPPSATAVSQATATPVSKRLPPFAARPTPTFAAYGITQTIGYSAEGRPLVAHRFGYGARTLLFVGGIHGGYEWNTVLLAYRAIDHFEAHPEAAPANVTLYIIPVANPDGLHAVTGKDGRFIPEDIAAITTPGRFNGNDVDLNRNWDCRWAPEGEWNGRLVSGGDAPFSEPETKSLRQFILSQQVDLAVFWHSKADGVYAGGCTETFLPALEAATIYGEAAGYNVHESFTAYPVTGDASDWLARQGVPSFTVELETHNELDWPQNLAGIEAMLDYFSRSITLYSEQESR